MSSGLPAIRNSNNNNINKSVDSAKYNNNDNFNDDGESEVQK